MIKTQITVVKGELVRRAYILGGIVVLLWVIELIDQILWGVAFDSYGIRPRTLPGLRNILFAPFLHHGLGHLIANTMPFLLLGWFVTMRGVGEFLRVSLMAALVSGSAIWLFGGSRTIHLGISSVVFGYLGYLLVRGYLERSPSSTILALLALLFYGGLLWGLLIWQPGVSWLGHTFGFLGGGSAAYRYGQRVAQLPRNNSLV
jgi:membrane associated rhomboid family serine protease